MAKDLYDRKLPFFEGLVLGQVCHVVELAIQRDLLHYENNLLLPAQACGKYHNAIYGVPTASAANQRHTPSANYVQSMEELKHLMADLLTRYPDGFNLSTLKTKIKVRPCFPFLLLCFYLGSLLDGFTLTQGKGMASASARSALGSLITFSTFLESQSSHPTS